MCDRAIPWWYGGAIAEGFDALVEELEHREIGFRSLQERIDTTTSGGKLIFHLFGALAEFERNLIRE